MDDDITIFAIVPIEVLLDKRLTLTHLRVLIAVLSYRNKNTNLAYMGRDALSARCRGIHLVNLSKALVSLCKFGWLTKEYEGGKKRRVNYKFHVPDLSELAHPANSELAHPANSELAHPANSELAHPANSYIEQTNEQTSEHTSAAGKQRLHDKIIFDESQHPPTFRNISNEQMQMWHSAFPKLDLDSELTRIEVWLSANPNRHKKNYERFIFNWLARTTTDAKPRMFIKQQTVTL